MTITFLGTGTSQGVPVIACDCAICTSQDPRDNRTRTSVMVEHAGKRVIIDTGPDFRAQMLREKVKSIDGIVFTHEHKDHIGGLDDIRPFNYLNKWRAQIFCNKNVQNAIQTTYPYVFLTEKYPGVPELDLNIIDETEFKVSGIPFQPIPLMHLHLPVFGYRIHDFTYITDANFISEESKDLVRNSKVLVLNALRREKHPSHFNLTEALELIEELQPERAFLTHISHQLGKHEDVSKELPDHVQLAWDGLKLELT